MRTNTTPTYEFILPFSLSNVDKYSITFKQGEKVVLKKLSGDKGVTDNNDIITAKLTETETALFTPGIATAQIKVMINDNIVASEIITIVVKSSYDTETWGEIDNV